MSSAALATEDNHEIDAQVEAFLNDLTELSRKHRLGITGAPVLFCLEDEDLENVYTCDTESRLLYELIRQPHADS